MDRFIKSIGDRLRGERATEGSREDEGGQTGQEQGRTMPEPARAVATEAVDEPFDSVTDDEPVPEDDEFVPDEDVEPGNGDDAIGDSGDDSVDTESGDEQAIGGSSGYTRGDALIVSGTPAGSGDGRGAYANAATLADTTGTGTTGATEDVPDDSNESDGAVDPEPVPDDDSAVEPGDQDSVGDTDIDLGEDATDTESDDEQAADGDAGYIRDPYVPPGPSYDLLPPEDLEALFGSDRVSDSETPPEDDGADSGSGDVYLDPGPVASDPDADDEPRPDEDAPDDPPETRTKPVDERSTPPEHPRDRDEEETANDNDPGAEVIGRVDFNAELAADPFVGLREQIDTAGSTSGGIDITGQASVTDEIVQFDPNPTLTFSDDDDDEDGFTSIRLPTKPENVREPGSVPPNPQPKPDFEPVAAASASTLDVMSSSTLAGGDAEGSEPTFASPVDMTSGGDVDGGSSLDVAGRVPLADDSRTGSLEGTAPDTFRTGEPVEDQRTPLEFSQAPEVAQADASFSFQTQPPLAQQPELVNTDISAATAPVEPLLLDQASETPVIAQLEPLPVDMPADDDDDPGDGM